MAESARTPWTFVGECQHRGQKRMIGSHYTITPTEEIDPTEYWVVGYHVNAAFEWRAKRILWIVMIFIVV